MANVRPLALAPALQHAQLLERAVADGCEAAGERCHGLLHAGVRCGDARCPDGAAAAFLLFDWPSAQLRPLRALMRAYIDFGYVRLDAPLQLPAHAACHGLRPLAAALLLRHADSAGVLLEAGALERPHSADHLLQAAGRMGLGDAHAAGPGAVQDAHALFVRLAGGLWPQHEGVRRRLGRLAEASRLALAR
jgi:hypothetical protein